jgi:Ca2+-binding RTX toxin-like protein
MTFIYDNFNSVTNGASFTSSNTIIVTEGAFIENFAGPFNEGLRLSGGSYTVSINGVVGSEVATSHGDGLVFVDLVGKSKLTVGATGHIFGFDDAVVAQHPTDIINAGILEGGTYGITASGSGDYKIVNSGEIHGGSLAIFIVGSGTHTIANSGHLFSGIDASFGGIEHVSNRGNIDAQIDLGLGNDTFTNTVKVGKVLKYGHVQGNILMGGGDDVFIGGKFHDQVTDEGGKDVYKLGAGDDDFHAVGTPGSGDGFTDTVDGGAGTDWYDAQDATHKLSINLDTKNHFDPIFGQTDLAGIVNDAGGGDTGIDKIRNFENVDGGSNNDSIFGSAAANQIYGNGGNDNLFGLGGNDFIYGGFGLDDLFGGIGADYLNGGGADLAVDRFHFTSLKDSTPGLAGRDLITGFEDGKDIVDLSDLNTSGTMGFVGVDVHFLDLTPGDVRVMTIQSGWLIQVDAGTDGKVDMAIQVQDASHSITWSNADFAFA